MMWQAAARPLPLMRLLLFMLFGSCKALSGRGGELMLKNLLCQRAFQSQLFYLAEFRNDIKENWLTWFSIACCSLICKASPMQVYMRGPRTQENQPLHECKIVILSRFACCPSR